MTKVRVFAPAKINLTLHITGKRHDGYHELDSLVAFADVGDNLTARCADDLSLRVSGPEATGVPTDDGNLVLQAARAWPGASTAEIHLEKTLPAASGIGGGSSDAAAAIRACLSLSADLAGQTSISGKDLAFSANAQILTKIGADIPMCLFPHPLRARGIGERISYCNLPEIPALLVNPRVSVSTGAVFSALNGARRPAMPPDLPTFPDAEALIEWLGEHRNDLEDPARRVAPEIGAALSALAATRGCRLSRMSGSGATCFGLYASPEAASEAHRSLRETHPHWWIQSVRIGDMSARALPERA